MLTTGIPTLHRYVISGVRCSHPITLFPFGDVHRDSKNCAVARWHAFLDAAREVPDAYFFGLGDYGDFLSTSGRAAHTRSLPDAHETEVEEREEKADDNWRVFAREIEFMKGRLIGLMDGNHFFRYRNDDTSTTRMCKHLGCDYLGSETFVRLVLSEGKCVKAPAHTNVLDIYAHHGAATSAQTSGGSLAAIERKTTWVKADIILMGHDHQLGAWPKELMGIAHDAQNDTHGLRLQESTVTYVRTGSFLLSRVPGRASYQSDKVYRPSVLGVPRITITSRSTHSGERFLEVESTTGGAVPQGSYDAPAETE